MLLKYLTQSISYRSVLQLPELILRNDGSAAQIVAKTDTAILIRSFCFQCKDAFSVDPKSDMISSDLNAEAISRIIVPFIRLLLKNRKFSILLIQTHSLILSKTSYHTSHSSLYPKEYMVPLAFHRKDCCRKLIIRPVWIAGIAFRRSAASADGQASVLQAKYSTKEAKM